MLIKLHYLKAIVFLTGAIFLFTFSNDYAIPSFARQTNLPCSTCHYVYPELTPFGRLFKLNAYTMTGIATIQSTYKENETNLKILNLLPISAAIQGSYNRTQKDVPGTKNDIMNFPQQFSLYVAGEISPQFGSFIQVSYEESSGMFMLDMTDLRFADHTTFDGNDVLYGITLNNSPTMQDVWQTTPMWNFPFVGSDVAPSPGAQTLFTNDDKVGMNVAGLGAYALYDNLIYGEISFYRSTHQGPPFPADATSENTLKGFTPYWRLALQQQWGSQYLEVGTFGMASQFYPTGISGITDKYLDLAFDAQYENSLSSGTIIAHALYINEKQNFDATYAEGSSSNPTDKLSNFKIDCSYNFPAGYALSAGYFTTDGDSDPDIYGRGVVDGFYKGSPNSSGIIAQVTYLPWLNTQFSLQYVFYNKFNGASSNYDGHGRNASDNNTLYVNGWVLF